MRASRFRLSGLPSSGVFLAGLSDREIIARAVEEHAGADATLVDPLLEELHGRYCRIVDEGSPILQATIDLVGALRPGRVPMGIVTGAQRDDVQYVLSRSPLAEAFSVILTEEDVTSGKPDPQGFLICSRALGVDPVAVLVFEDSVHGPFAELSPRPA